MDFEIVSEKTAVETMRLAMEFVTATVYVSSTWVFAGKLKGVARVRLSSGRIGTAEIHWYEAYGVGKREFKLKLPFIK